MNFYAVADLKAQAEFWQEQLNQLNYQVNLILVEQINIKFLRTNPDLSLILDDDGVHLAWNGMKMQPAWHDELYRLKQASRKNELLARACQVKQGQQILDATAGLGHDGLLLASLGAKLTMLERHPILYVLLQASLQQARQQPTLQQIVENIQIIHVDATDYLREIAVEQFDLIYLDPMFPQRDANQKQAKKQAQVKKQMQILHHLLAEQDGVDLGEALLDLALAKAHRVIVKRPRHAEPLNQAIPQHQWLGDACRFDGYFAEHSTGQPT